MTDQVDAGEGRRLRERGVERWQAVADLKKFRNAIGGTDRAAKHLAVVPGTIERVIAGTQAFGPLLLQGIYGNTGCVLQLTPETKHEGPGPALPPSEPLKGDPEKFEAWVAESNALPVPSRVVGGRPGGDPASLEARGLSVEDVRGDLQRLSDALGSVKRLAEELGVSLQSVYNARSCARPSATIVENLYGESGSVLLPELAALLSVPVTVVAPAVADIPEPQVDARRLSADATLPEAEATSGAAAGADSPAVAGSELDQAIDEIMAPALAFEPVQPLAGGWAPPAIAAIEGELHVAEARHAELLRVLAEGPAEVEALAGTIARIHSCLATIRVLAA